jgi:hypothetical protein
MSLLEDIHRDIAEVEQLLETRQAILRANEYPHMTDILQRKIERLQEDHQQLQSLLAPSLVDSREYLSSKHSRLMEFIDHLLDPEQEEKMALLEYAIEGDRVAILQLIQSTQEHMQRLDPTDPFDMYHLRTYRERLVHLQNLLKHSVSVTPPSVQAKRLPMAEDTDLPDAAVARQERA